VTILRADIRLRHCARGDEEDQLILTVDRRRQYLTSLVQPNGDRR
jgi:hypothetical protein